MLKFWRSRKSNGKAPDSSRKPSPAPSGLLSTNGSNATLPKSTLTTATTQTETEGPLHGLGFAVGIDTGEAVSQADRRQAEGTGRELSRLDGSTCGTGLSVPSTKGASTTTTLLDSKDVRALRDLNGRSPTSTRNGFLSVDSVHKSLSPPALSPPARRNSQDRRATSPSLASTTWAAAGPQSRNRSYASGLDGQDPSDDLGRDGQPGARCEPVGTRTDEARDPLGGGCKRRTASRDGTGNPSETALMEFPHYSYVAELRSLVEKYSNPLLHPHLSTSPSVPPSLSPRPSSARTLSPYLSSPATSASSAELPIASRFSRSPSPQPVPDRLAADLSVIDFAEGAHSEARDPQPSGVSYLGRPSLPELPTGARRTLSPAPLEPVHSNASTGRLASFGSRARSSLRPASSSRKLRGSESSLTVDNDWTAVPPLPESLRNALQATIDMLQGHEDLSSRLKEQWIKAFPLVRGLAAIWSEQPWFLHTYTAYIVALEDALATLEAHLGAATRATEQANRKRLFKSSKSREDSSVVQLGLFLRRLEEQAAAAGESNLGICLSKPLMRLSKLPLLMQALLYHTDPTTHEWEKTRTMALEVDALVRSIEDEKLDQDDRETARDALARIDGIRDQALMAPRGARVLLDERPAPPSALTHKRSSRRLSTAPAKRSARNGSNDWLVVFTDVVVRVEKVGETESETSAFSLTSLIPFEAYRAASLASRRRRADKANYARLESFGIPLETVHRTEISSADRFVGIERWETPEDAEAALEVYYELRRADEVRTDADESSSFSDRDAESQMSFQYDGDEPKPVRRNFRTSNGNRDVGVRSPSPTKFAGRLREGTRPISPDSNTRDARYDAPTVSSMLKAQQRAVAPPCPPSPPRPRQATARPLSFARDDSTYGLYSIWAEAERN
ncbi:hypothetical protein BMF94_1555 [Rhodotorula taiwanensis]|uniref:DH domain-containing protein n=1 Tax=Rhodotorula taiwanensis TaxID=741276 RepID=A0A2S5BEX4_9BASI|nr:hypothetical protein BMF94_1555 [Rhodotorula taiwanensis]